MGGIGPLAKKGVKALFDMSDARSVPDVPQFALERYDPPRGMPKGLASIMTPENARRLEEIAKRGMDMGGPEWYYTVPLKERFIIELGPEEGPLAFRRFIDYVSATSPRAKVPENIRRGSYFYGRERQGLPVTVPKGDLPPGYGHLAHTSAHMSSLRDLEGGGTFAALNRPKTTSFSENLSGNWKPLTIDTHNMKVVANVDRSPTAGEYGYLEQYQSEIADKLGLTPAQFQASLWVAGDTGVANIKPFLVVFDEVVERTAVRDKKGKEEVLRDFITGEAPLFGLATLMSGLMVQDDKPVADGMAAGGAVSAVAKAIRRLVEAGFPESTAEKIVMGELPMDPATKAARMQEQGFAPGQVRYHATDSVFDAFDDAYLGRDTAANVTDFSEGSFANNLAMLGHWTSDRPLAEALSRERSMPLMLRGRRQDFDSLEALSDAVTNAGGVRAFQDDLLSEGFGGVNVRDEEFGGLSQVTFNPADLRSPEAAFDPDQAGSPNLMAGLGPAAVGAGLLGAAMTPEEAEAAGFGTLARAIGRPTQRLFQGSPSKFARPSMQSVGTGTGNQAFGYGLYFTEAPDIAGTYKRGLANKKMIQGIEDQGLVPGVTADELDDMIDEGVFGEAETRFLSALRDADYLGFDNVHNAAMVALKRGDLAKRYDAANDPAVAELDKIANELGFLYEVEVPGESFIEWDLPLDQQPEVVQQVVKQNAPPELQKRIESGQFKGLEAYYLFGKDPEVNSMMWGQYGVPGIRYSSVRTKEGKTSPDAPRNYVIFDENLINIVRRNDEALENNFDELAARMSATDVRKPIAAVLGAGAAGATQAGQDDVPDYMRRLDGSVKSERGFLGPIRNNVSGRTMTEVSVGQPGSEEGFYPLLVPTLTRNEIETIANMDLGRERPPRAIIEKARAHAMDRIDRGLSPFYQDGEETAGAMFGEYDARASERLSQELDRLLQLAAIERQPKIEPLDDRYGLATIGDYLTENRPSEMDTLQRALQSNPLVNLESLGDALRTTGYGDETTLEQDIMATLDLAGLLELGFLPKQIAQLARMRELKAAQ